MVAALVALALVAPHPLALAGVQAGQPVRTIEERLSRAGWRGQGGTFTGLYQGRRAVLRVECGASACKPQAVPQAVRLTLYSPTCKAALAAVIRENGRPDDARLQLGSGPDESLWRRNNASLTAYCTDGVVFARLRKL